VAGGGALDRQGFVDEWRGYLESFETIDEAQMHVNLLERWGDGEVVASPNRALAIDLDGYAKGVALDRAAAILRAQGVTDALVNIGGAIPGSGDMSTFGAPSKFSYLAAENEAQSPWEPLHMERGLPRAIADYSRGHDLDLWSHPSAEAQAGAISDDIAYDAHDIDDGLSSGLLDPEGLAAAVALFGEPLGRARERWPLADPRRHHTVALRGLINDLVTDLIETTSANIVAAEASSVTAVRDAGRLLASLSSRVAAENRALKAYLRTHLYEHHRIERMKDKARRVLQALCERYFENPKLLPEVARRRSEAEGLHRAIADYIAGMTDRFAEQEFERLTGHQPAWKRARD